MAEPTPEDECSPTHARDNGAPGDQSASDDPRATSHPTGEKQAAENAENEPVG